MAQCECVVCQYGRQVDAFCQTLTADQSVFVQNMYERLCEAEMDRDWAQAKLRGDLDTEA